MPGNCCMAMLVDALPIMELVILLLCWLWVTNIKIGMTAIEDGSGRIPSCFGCCDWGVQAKPTRRKSGEGGTGKLLEYHYLVFFLSHVVAPIPHWYRNMLLDAHPSLCTVLCDLMLAL